MAATADFLKAIGEYKSVRDGGPRRSGWSRCASTRARARPGELDEFLKQSTFPLVAHLRDTQVYVYCARDGYSVFDLPRSRGEQDWEQWRPLTRWLAKHAAVRS
jgi:chromosome partitioning protein